LKKVALISSVWKRDHAGVIKLKQLWVYEHDYFCHGSGKRGNAAAFWRLGRTRWYGMHQGEAVLKHKSVHFSVLCCSSMHPPSPRVRVFLLPIKKNGRCELQLCVQKKTHKKEAYK
jgi:hypothetical protein